MDKIERIKEVVIYRCYKRNDRKTFWKISSNKTGRLY